MDITFLGGLSFKLRGKQTSLITDPYKSSSEFPFPKQQTDIVTISRKNNGLNQNEIEGEAFVIEGPGEYEIKGVKISGTPSLQSRKKEGDKQKNTIYNIWMDKINVCHLGKLGQRELSDEQLSSLGNVDILLVPTGSSYNMDAQEAAKLASSLEPKIVIPMHEEDQRSDQSNNTKEFLKEMGSENIKPEVKLSISKDKLPDEMQVIVLERKL